MTKDEINVITLSVKLAFLLHDLLGHLYVLKRIVYIHTRKIPLLAYFTQLYSNFYNHL